MGFNSRGGYAGMPQLLKTFCADEHGQDLTEYALLLAFVALAVIAILGIAQGSVTAIWGKTQNNLEAGVCSAVIGTS